MKNDSHSFYMETVYTISLKFSSFSVVYVYGCACVYALTHTFYIQNFVLHDGIGLQKFNFV